MTKRTLIVGGDLEQAAKRVAEAWHRAERGETIEAELTGCRPLRGAGKPRRGSR